MDAQRPPSLWRVYRAVADTLRQMIGPALGALEWLRVTARTHGLRDTPRRRPNQAVQARSLRLYGAGTSQS